MPNAPDAWALGICCVAGLAVQHEQNADKLDRAAPYGRGRPLNCNAAAGPTCATFRTTGARAKGDAAAAQNAHLAA